MKALLILFILLSSVVSAQPIAWRSVQRISERHEFYKDDEVIKKPAGAWQVLFAVIFPGSNLLPLKDCVVYRVPGDELGVLKILTVNSSRSCEDAMYDQSDKEYRGIKALQFSIKDKVTLKFDGKDHSGNWVIPLPELKRSPGASMSSWAFKSPVPVLLAKEGGEGEIYLEDGNLCHEIGDTCEELKPSSCQRCRRGWYEIPNGCSHGPKYCGVQDCGALNKPACRRGMVYQRRQQKFDCARDASFAFCNPGLKVFCQGSLAYCH